MSFLVSNLQFKALVPIVTPFVGNGGGTDDIAGGFLAPPGVDWHCVPANLNVLSAAVAAPSVFVGSSVIQPRLGGVDTGPSLTKPGITHSASGAVAMSVPPVAVDADLFTNKFGASVSNSMINERIAWMLKFDAPFEAWQLVANGWPSAQNAGLLGNTTTQHIAPFSYVIGVQDFLRTMPWPVAGTFRYLLAVTLTNVNVSANPVFELGLSVNNADTIMVTTPTVTNANTRNLMLDTTSTQHVDAGDLVNFVFRRTDAGGDQPQSGTRFYISIGFLPD